MRRIIIGALFALFALTAHADEVPRDQAVYLIKFSGGGQITHFIQKYSALRDDGTKIVLDGPCYSACTFFLGILPPSEVCATPNALLGFHSGSVFAHGGMVRIHDEGATRLVWAMYPENVQSLLRILGWDGKSEHHDFIEIKGYALSTIVRPCKG